MSLGDIRNLDYTILLCSKLAETKAFYLDVMGFPLLLRRVFLFTSSCHRSSI